MRRKYLNIIEELVESEVGKQLQNLPQIFHKYKFYINPVDVVTYALNRLPPLYASSRQGKNHQLEKAQKLTLETTVRQAIVAILNDPLKQNEPLTILEPNQLIDEFVLSQALADLEAFLKEHALISDLEKVTSQNLVRIFQKVLQKNSRSLQFVLKELQDILSQKQLIDHSKNLDLDNLVDIMKSVILQLEKIDISPKALSVATDYDLEVYKNVQLEIEEDEEDIPTEPMSDFGRIKS